MPGRRSSLALLALTLALAALLPLALVACGSPTIHDTMDDATITARWTWRAR